MNTFRRDVLNRKVEKGEMEARCTFAFTDGYTNANNGETEWMPARIKAEHDTFPDKTITLYPTDFKTKTGYANKNADGTYALKVHGNLLFELREKGADL